MRFVKPSATLTAALTLTVASALFGAQPWASAQAAPAKSSAPAPQKAPAKKQPQKAPSKTAPPAASFRRDPFQPLISKAEPGSKPVPENLPPGPGGLIVATVKLEGIVRAPSGMIAVVSNPQGRVYFIREGQALYDGTLEKISLDKSNNGSISLRERGKDPFGKSVDRLVVKRLYPRAGEQ